MTYTAKVPAGASVAVFGCGGVGLNAGAGRGPRVGYPIIAVDISDSKLEHARAMGACHVFNSASRRRRPRRHPGTSTGGRGVEYALIAVGKGQVVQQAWASLANGGTAVMVGLMPSGELLSIDPSG